MSINDLKQLWQQAFGDTEDFLDDFFCVAYSEDRCATIEEDGNLAAMLYWFDCIWEDRKIAYIYAVATDEAYRNRGLCRDLMDATHAKLQAQGYAGAVLVPGNRELFGLYEKMGYVPFCPMTRVTMEAGDTPADLAVLSSDEYSKRRRPFLPQGAVEEGDLMLDFLATYCKLYVCEGCVFSGAMDDEMFYFQEFLGEPGWVPGILKALGAEKGVLRLPGGAPYAMYRTLTENETLPTYFSIPLN